MLFSCQDACTARFVVCNRLIDVRVLRQGEGDYYEDIGYPTLPGCSNSETIYVLYSAQAMHFEGLLRKTEVEPTVQQVDFMARFDQYRGRAADSEKTEVCAVDKVSRLDYPTQMERLSSADDAMGMPGVRNHIYMGGSMRKSCVDVIKHVFIQYLLSKGINPAERMLYYIGSGNGKNLANFVPEFGQTIGVEVNGNQVSVAKSNEMTILQNHPSLPVASGYSCHEMNFIHTDGIPRMAAAVFSYNEAFGVDNHHFCDAVFLSDAAVVVMFRLSLSDFYGVYEKVANASATIRGSSGAGGSHTGLVIGRVVFFINARDISPGWVVKIHEVYQAASTREKRIPLLGSDRYKDPSPRLSKKLRADVRAEERVLPRLVALNMHGNHATVIDFDSSGNDLVRLLRSDFPTANVHGVDTPLTLVAGSSEARALFIGSESRFAMLKPDTTKALFGTCFLCTETNRAFHQGGFLFFIQITLACLTIISF